MKYVYFILGGIGGVLSVYYGFYISVLYNVIALLLVDFIYNSINTK